MAKKVIRLTNDEFRSMINEAVTKALMMKDGNTALSVSDESTNAPGESRKEQVMSPGDEPNFLQDFEGFTFKFFGEDGRGLVVNILFTFDKLTKLSSEKTILTVTVSYNNQSVIGDGITVSFDRGTVIYRERGSRYNYSLEIDRRTKPQWDALLQQLQGALGVRSY